MINKIVTKGLGGNQTVGLVLMGFTLEIARIIRGGRSVAKDIYDEFLIAAKLIEINGKELFSPIFNRRKYVVNESTDVTVSVDRKTVIKKDSDSISVTANISNIKRGYYGKD